MWFLGDMQTMSYILVSIPFMKLHAAQPVPRTTTLGFSPALVASSPGYLMLPGSETGCSHPIFSLEDT